MSLYVCLTIDHRTPVSSFPINLDRVQCDQQSGSFVQIIKLNDWSVIDRR